MSRADTAIRVTTAGVVGTVAAFAAVVSYSHIYDLARSHGEAGTAARLLPLSVDGLILAASLVMLHEARSGDTSPLARWLMGLGVAATVAGNVGFGYRYGPAGALISAWPALSFVGSAELLMVLVRKARVRTQVQPGTCTSTAGTNGHDPDLVRFREFIEKGDVPGIKAIKAELHVGQNRAMEVQSRLRALTGPRVAE